MGKAKQAHRDHLRLGHSAGFSQARPFVGCTKRSVPINSSLSCTARWIPSKSSTANPYPCRWLAPTRVSHTKPQRHEAFCFGFGRRLALPVPLYRHAGWHPASQPSGDGKPKYTHRLRGCFRADAKMAQTSSLAGSRNLPFLAPGFRLQAGM